MENTGPFGFLDILQNFMGSTVGYLLSDLGALVAQPFFWLLAPQENNSDFLPQYAFIPFLFALIGIACCAPLWRWLGKVLQLRKTWPVFAVLFAIFLMIGMLAAFGDFARDIARYPQAYKDVDTGQMLLWGLWPIGLAILFVGFFFAVLGVAAGKRGVFREYAA